MWKVFSMINPPLIAVGNTGMQIYSHTTLASVEEESGMDLGFKRKLTKIILNSLAFSGQMTSDQLKQRVRGYMHFVKCHLVTSCSRWSSC